MVHFAGGYVGELELFAQGTACGERLRVLEQVLRVHESVQVLNGLEFEVIRSEVRYYINWTHKQQRSYLEKLIGLLRQIHDIYVKFTIFTSNLRYLRQIHNIYVKFMIFTSNSQYFRQIHNIYVKFTIFSSNSRYLRQIYVIYVKFTIFTSNSQYLRQI